MSKINSSSHSSGFSSLVITYAASSCLFFSSSSYSGLLDCTISIRLGSSITIFCSYSIYYSYFSMGGTSTSTSSSFPSSIICPSILFSSFSSYSKTLFSLSSMVICSSSAASSSSATSYLFATEVLGFSSFFSIDPSLNSLFKVSPIDTNSLSCSSLSSSSLSSRIPS